MSNNGRFFQRTRRRQLDIMKSAITKDTVRSVQRSMSRFISIIAIVALGISFFAGMSAVAPDMRDTCANYYDSTNIMDIQIMSSIGLTDDDLHDISNINGVEKAVTQNFVDGLLLINGAAAADMDGSQLSVRLLSLDINKAANFAASGVDDPDYMNRVTLVEGSLPTASNQCLVDASMLSTPDEFKIGTTISVDGDDSDLSSKLVNTEYTIVGIIRTPLYISYDRGSTTVGNGKLSTFIYVPSENFTLDYYSMIWCKIVGSDAYEPYSEEYKSFIKPYTEAISSVAGGNITSRAETLKIQYTAEVEQGELDYKTASQDAQIQLDNAKKQLDELKTLAETGDDQIAEMKAKYNEMASQANANIDSSKLEYSSEYSSWEEKRDKYNKAKALVEQYDGVEAEYNNALTSYNVAKTQTDSTLTTVKYLEDVIATTRSAMDMLDENQSTSVSSIIDRFAQSGVVGEEVDSIMASIKSLTAMGTAEEISAALEPQLQTLEQRLATSKASLESAQTELVKTKEKLDKMQVLVTKLNELKSSLTSAEAELNEAEKKLSTANNDIQFNQLEILSKLQDLKFQITNAETNVTMAKEKVKTADAEYETTVNDVKAKLLETREKLDEAQKQLKELDIASRYIWDRDSALCGYEEYGQTIDRTRALSAIFPWIFFLVAALVCLNTMTRMVDEERTQLGTLKALGYSDVQIASKYLIYAFTASFIGCVAGSCLGFYIFPAAISKAFGILYDLPQIHIAFRWLYAVGGSVIAIGTTVLAALFASFNTLRCVPATLMRPKAPKNGKRVFLEKLTFIWSRLNFTSKVTVRNVIRSKKRFIMAVAGVMGCTALMVAGFGLSDSINVMLTRQYTDDDSICKYDLLVALKVQQDLSQGDSEVLTTVLQRPEISQAMLEYIKVMDGTSANSQKAMEVYLVVPQEASTLSNFTQLKSRTTGEEYSLDNNGVIITEKLANEINVKTGDEMLLRDGTGKEVSVRVSGIVENYTFHYVYMSRTVYGALYGSDAVFNYIAATLTDSVTAQQQQALASELMQNYQISAASFTQDASSMFENIAKSLNYVVIVLTLSAGLLALIVLYNLSNININERIREIATLKVLGFRSGEVSAYIFRENLILSVIGTLLGLVAGVFLHKLVIGVADVDIVMFGRSISWVSYFYAAVLSMGFSLLVNLILFRRLKRVDMVESLKSVE